MGVEDYTLLSVQFEPENAIKIFLNAQIVGSAVYVIMGLGEDIQTSSYNNYIYFLQS